VHDEGSVVGDNNLDWVSPVLGARSRQCLKAVQHGCWWARRWRELAAQTLMCEWAVLAVGTDWIGEAQAGMA
jgi:hypothetical protein